MTQGNLTSFIEDRFGCLNSALALNGGWSQVPSGVYFDSPEFTISVWILPQQVGYWARMIDFGNGAPLENLFLSLSDGTNRKPQFSFFSGGSAIINAGSTQNLTLDEWQFLAVTFNETTSSIYLNGTLTAQVSGSYSLPTLNRTNCYIGKSNWYWDGYSSSYLDDLRFYNKSLTHIEIISLMVMNQTQTSKEINFFMKYLFLFQMKLFSKAAF